MSSIEQQEFRSKARILVAEDAEFNQLLIKEILKNAGHELVFVENGRLAMEELGSSEFDLVLMDIQMPVMDGFETIAAIRGHSNPKISKIIIISLTAHVMIEELEKIKGTGANEVLLKPLNKDQFIHTIQTYLSNRNKPQIGKILDLSNLSEISEGDKNVEKAFLTTFAEQTKGSLTDLKSALKIKDKNRVKKVLHKMINSFNMFDMPMREKVSELSENEAIDLDQEANSINDIANIAMQGIEEAELLSK